MMTLFALSPASSAKAANAEFKPIMEAEMPAGFPAYTPVDQIEVKQYPAYRKAVSNGSAAFWSLFSHIKQNKIAMTAPVEMTYGSPDSDRLQQQSMAFLYGQPSLGSTGSQGSVEVVDVPAAKVVSIGVRGARTDGKVNEAREKLEAWLTNNGLRASGELRVMGYNSPFVPRDRQFFEVQIPVANAQ
jgi:hypothetical protein